MPFVRGANPFAGASQEPMRLLESITPMQLASCVPLVRITKIEKFGKPATDVRPLMFDLSQTPQFGATGERFGVDSDTFIERSLVSLNSLSVEFNLNYGQQLWREVVLEFTVHRPEVVFDRNSKIAWREILEAGKSFSLEYGWTADLTLVQNELFNGVGVVTDKGLVIKGTQSILLNVYSYNVSLSRTGEAHVVVKALENGDLALRGVKFSDAIERSESLPEADDQTNFRRVKSLLDGLGKNPEMGRGSYYNMGEVLDRVLAPAIVASAKNWGYSSVDLLLGDFNVDAGPESQKYGGKPMGGRSIGDFMVPVSSVNTLLSTHLGKGRTLYLSNFVSMVINLMNGEGAWAHPPPGADYRQPNLQMRSDTVRKSDGTYGLVLVIYDVKTGTNPFHGDDRLTLDRQSRADVMAKLASLDVPVLQFARAGSLILDSNFELQPDPLLQAQQIDFAYKDQKDRVQLTATPDVQGRVGQARAGELVMPISILQGDVTMYGNFALEAFAILWIDFFGSSEISGVFHVYGKTDRIEPGKFTSTFKVISESIDPLNTRRRKTDPELAEDRARAAEVRKKKPSR